MTSLVKLSRLEHTYRSLEAITTFLKPALPFINSHLTEFYTASYWEKLLPKALQEDLELKSIDEFKQHIADLTNDNWRSYSCSVTNSFKDSKTLESLIMSAGNLQLSSLNTTVQPQELYVNGKQVWSETSWIENDLKLDRIMSAKKTHEVEVMSEFITRISASILPISNSDSSEKNPKSIEYLVDVGSGKGYLSSFLTLMHKFKVLAVDSSSMNTSGCEKRSAKLEKVWIQLIRRAIERKIHGTCTKRGKNWKSKNRNKWKSMQKVEGSTENTEGSIEDGNSSQAPVTNQEKEPIEEKEQENKFLKTLTQFVTPDFDLTESIQHNFPQYASSEINNDKDKDYFGLIGLHTCGTLGVDSLRLFIANQNAKFVCNVPCCYHLMEENPLHYPDRSFEGSKATVRNNDDVADSISNPGFPLSSKLDAEDSNPFYLGRNARMMSAYSLHRMAGEKNGMDLHPSIFYRCALQVLIKRELGEAYSEMHNYEHNVGKIGDKCANFTEYVRKGLENLRLTSRVQPSDEDIEEFYHAFGLQQKERLHKYYLLRSIFAPLVEGCILLDRLAFLLEQDCIEDAYIVEMFDPKVSPRSHAIFAFKS